MAERIDWVEIPNPRSGKLMYANVKTGDCLWKPPPSVKVKKTSEDQWWELYDEKTRRYYYYNAHTKQTEWRKPKEGDIIALAKLQNLKGRGSKRRSSSSRKDSSHGRRGSSSRKEGGDSRSSLDGERSLPRKYSRHNSGESLSHARKNSHGLHHTRSSAIQGLSSSETNDSKADEETARDKRGDSGEMRELASAHESLHITMPGDMQNSAPEPSHSNRSSNTSMDLDSTFSPADMDTATRNIEYLKISGGEIGDGTTKRADENGDDGDSLENFADEEATNDPDEADVTGEGGNIVESPLGSLVPPPESGTTSNCSVNHFGHVNDRPLSESETSAFSASFPSCDSKIGQSNPSWSVVPTRTSPTKDAGDCMLQPLEISRTTSFFNRMVDTDGNLRTFSFDESSRKVRRDANDHGNEVPPSVPVLRGEGGRRRSSSCDPKAYDNLQSPHHFSTYDNLNPDNSSEDDSMSLTDKLISGGMPSTTAVLVEDCEPMKSPTIDDDHHRSSRTYQHQFSDSVLDMAENNRLPNRPPLPQSLRVPKPLQRSNTCPVQHRSPSTPITPPPPALRFTEPDFSAQHRSFFGKKDNLIAMLSHSKQPIKKPVLTTRDKQLKKEAIEIFKLVLVYMGDRTSRNKDVDVALWEIVTKAWANQPIRDELYFQLIKQTTDNNSSSSLEKGWELMAVSLAMFPPSAKYHSYLEGYVYNHLKDNQKPNRVAQYAENCLYKLEKMAKTGSRKGQRQPTIEEVRAAKRAIFHPSMFGSTLDDTMQMQKCNFPDRKLPWILTCLTERIIQHNGTSTEGIFRVPGDIDEVNALKVKTDDWTYPDDCTDPNVAASLLKQWFRDLKEPLLDESVYDQCITNCDDETISGSIVTSLPEINRLVLCFIVRFLQIFCKPEVIRVTKMDVNNLSMVWAPNFLRCPSNEPKIIFENTRKEMTFVRTLLNSFETEFMEGVK